MRRASRRKFHFIYKTTCLTNNRYYIGMHSSDVIDDGYLGSGRWILNSIKRHGKENHRREILEMFRTRDECCRREEEYVNKQLLSDEMCMNLILGGSAVRLSPGDDTRERMRLAKLGKKQSPEHIAARSAGLKGCKQSDEKREKCRQAAKRQWDRRRAGDITAIGMRK